MISHHRMEHRQLYHTLRGVVVIVDVGIQEGLSFYLMPAALMMGKVDCRFAQHIMVRNCGRRYLWFLEVLVQLILMLENILGDFIRAFGFVKTVGYVAVGDVIRFSFCERLVPWRRCHKTDFGPMCFDTIGEANVAVLRI